MGGGSGPTYKQAINMASGCFPSAFPLLAATSSLGQTGGAAIHAEFISAAESVFNVTNSVFNGTVVDTPVSHPFYWAVAVVDGPWVVVVVVGCCCCGLLLWFVGLLRVVVVVVVVKVAITPSFGCHCVSFSRLPVRRAWHRHLRRVACHHRDHVCI